MQLLKHKKIQSVENIVKMVTPRSFIKRIGRDPYVDWVIIVIISVILAIILISMGLLKYSEFGSITQDQTATIKPNTSTLVDNKALDNVIEDFDTRAIMRSDLRKGYFGPGDPSI